MENFFNKEAQNEVARIIDDAAIAEERIDIFPLCTPAFADLRIFIVPDIHERIQRH